MTERTGDALRDLIASTLDFYDRFGVQPTLDGATNVFHEEVAEFIEAAQAGTDHDHTAEEAADVLVTVIGLCKAAGVDTERLIQQVYAVIAKNDAKTHETHVYMDGKIRRRS
ncbi:MAG: MazG nucleotide pyrophosphohydrolase domain-containing protein [bacterium]|nr:MazG nucleotide pyrophosphohydrolase domain-containing protein [bacterium]